MPQGRLSAALLALVLLAPGPAGAAPQDAPPPHPAPAPTSAPAPKPSAAKPNSVFLPRTAPRDKVFKETGSTAFGPETEKAVAAAVGWLVRHQETEGNWDADAYFQRCRGTYCDGFGGPLFDPALTGLSVLAILGSGATPRDAGVAGDALRKGLGRLVTLQDSEGCVGARISNHFVYNHAVGGLALAEAHALSGNTEFRDAAQKAAAFTVACQNPYLGWRYGVRPGDNDTSVTGWMATQLKTAEWAGLRVPPQALRWAIEWFDRVTELDSGRTGYSARGNGPARPQELMDAFPMEHSESLTAISLDVRLLCGAPVTSPVVARGLALFRAVLPRNEPRSYVDHYFWFWGTQATFQAGGDHWKAWQDPLVKTLLASQRKDEKECRRGSWDALDPWAIDGGRVYSTAILALCLEAPYRYTRVSTTPPERTTLNLETDPPGARVMLDDFLVGTTPLEDAPLPPGISVLRLVHPSTSETTLPVDLAPLERNEGGNVGLPSGVAVDLAAVPPAISVFHEGRRLAGAASVRPGKVRLTYVQPRCRVRVEVREMKKGEKLVLEDAPLEKVGDWSKAAVRNQCAPPAWTGPAPSTGGGMHVYEGRYYCEKDGSEMVVIPGFQPEGDPAKPVPPVPPLLVDRHEVTVAQYRRFCTETKRKPPKPPAGSGDDHPVVGLSCRDALEYAAWAGKRLPTPAEWYRAGYGDLPREMDFDQPYYPWGQFESAEARHVPEGDKIAARPEKVGSFPAGMSPCGALDIVGNAIEWCAPDIRDGKPVGFHLRGGSWMDGRWSRDLSIDEVFPDAGFRCVRDFK